MQAGPSTAHARVGPDQAEARDHSVERAAEALLREHPDALVCGLSGAGLIVPVPKSVCLWGQTALQGRAVIDHVVAEDRKTIAEMWVRVQSESAVRGRVRLLSSPMRWMAAHFLDLRDAHGGFMCIMLPTGEIADGTHDAAEFAPSAPRFSTLLEDERGNVLECDEAFTHMFGYTAADLIGKSVLDHIHPDDQGRAVESWITMLSTKRVQQSRIRRRRKDGSWMWVDLTLHNYLNHPDREHVLVEIIDSSAEMATQEALQEQGELLRGVIDAMPDGLLQVDVDRNVIFHNARLLEILGTAPAASTSALLATVRPDSLAAFELALSRVLEEGANQDVEVDVVLPSGEDRRVLMSIRALLRQGSQISGAIATALDVTDSARAREELERRATFDHLTRCHNRPSILSSLQHDLEGENRAETAVVFVDLDNFKAINDTLGHAMGDEALISVVERLNSTTRADDKIGRLGGDEFLLLIHGAPEPDVAMGVAQRICELLATPLELSCGPVELRASIGVAWSGDEPIAAEALIARADEAMYRSKEQRQGTPMLAAA